MIIVTSCVEFVHQSFETLDFKRKGVVSNKKTFLSDTIYNLQSTQPQQCIPLLVSKIIAKLNIIQHIHLKLLSIQLIDNNQKYFAFS